MNKPQITLKVAMSLDGFIDDCQDSRLVFSGKADQDAVKQLRADVDAILVGAGTLRADRPACNPTKTKVSLTSTGDFDWDCDFFSSGEGEKIIFVPNSKFREIEKLAAGRATVISAGEDTVDFSLMLNILFERGVKKLLVEGGEQIINSLISLGLVDQLRLAISSKVVGDPHAPRFNFEQSIKAFNLSSVEQLGDMAVHWYHL